MMESSLEISWDGKMEPPSPSQFTDDEFWLLEDSFANEVFNELIFSTTFEDVTKKSSKDLLTELFQPINIEEISERELYLISDDENEKEQWLDQKSNLSMLEDYPAAVPEPPVYIQQVNNQNTDDLIMEFDSIYDAVELTHLTPPQTPPQQYGDIVMQQRTQQQQVYQQINYQQLQQPQQQLVPTTNENIAMLQQQLQQQPSVRQEIIPQMIAFDDEYSFDNEIPTDIARELEVVDELVRSRSKDLPDWTTDDDSVSCSGSSGSVSGGSPRSESSSYCSSNYSNDDEWSQKSVKSSASSTGGSPSNSVLKLSLSSSGVTKKRTRPYARGGGEEKKSRKKEQNKNAATRYRQKKKAEIEEVLVEERGLADINDTLQTKYNDLKLEIKYLKSLMKELCKAKGLLD